MWLWGDLHVHVHVHLSLSLSSSSEIPQFRLPYDVVSYEVELMKDLGVKVHVHVHRYSCIANM